VLDVVAIWALVATAVVALILALVDALRSRPRSWGEVALVVAVAPLLSYFWLFTLGPALVNQYVPVLNSVLGLVALSSSAAVTICFSRKYSPHPERQAAGAGVRVTV